jgi:hypothetical protein
VALGGLHGSRKIGRSLIFHRSFTTNQPIDIKTYKKYYFSSEVLKPLSFLPPDIYNLCYRNYQKREEFVWRVIKDMEAYVGAPISPISRDAVEERSAAGELFDMYLPIGERTDMRVSCNKIRIVQNKYATKHRTFTGFYNEYYANHHSNNLLRARGECYIEPCGNNEYGLGAVVDGLGPKRAARVRPSDRVCQYDPRSRYELHALRRYVPRTKFEIECYDRLMQFLHEKVYLYKAARNKIQSTGTSQLAPYFALGVMSFEYLVSIIRTVFETQSPDRHSIDVCYGPSRSGSLPPLDERSLESCNEFDRQCHWLLYSKLSAPKDIGIPPPLSPEQQDKFVQWTDGNLPENSAVDSMVNTQMRRLKGGQVVSNRFRLMVSNYLVKRLGIDWRYGEFYFEAALIDSHPEINRKNWDGQMRSRFFNCYNLETQLAQYGH